MNASREVRAELLSPAELDAALADAPIAYLPLGSLEFHGPHLPIGLDSLNALGVCIAAAQLSGGIVLPVVHQGTGGGHGDYPWSIMMDGSDTIAAHLTQTLTRLDDFGVKRAVLFTGHFASEQLDLVDRVASEWNEASAQPPTQAPDVAGNTAPTGAPARLRVVATGVNRCPDAPIAPDHAGVFESTLLAAIRPDLVHLDRLPSLEEHPANDPAGDSSGDHRHDPSHPLWGVFGPDPRAADLTRAPALLAHLAAWLAARAAPAASA